MHILGIDPGYESMGYALVHVKKPSAGSMESQTLIEAGCVRTSARKKFPDRLVELEHGLSQIIEEYAVGQAAVERLFYVRAWKGSLNIAEARGVIMMSLARHAVEIFEYAPSQVKKAVTGDGHANKQKIMLMTAKLLNLSKPIAEDNAADALALALVHSFQLRASSS